MTPSPYNPATGEITGGFKPPFNGAHFGGTSEDLSWVIDANGKAFVKHIHPVSADTFAAVLNDYCEMKKKEEKCKKANKEIWEAWFM